MAVDIGAAAMAGMALTMLVHFVATIWWAASLTKRVEHVERWIINHERTAERLAALETQVNNVSTGIARIERHLSARKG